MPISKWMGLAAVVLLAALMGSLQPAWAQAPLSAAPDAGRLLQQERNNQPAPPAPTDAAPLRGIPPSAAASAATHDAMRVQVKGFRLRGEPAAFSTRELLALLQPAVGREMSLAELRRVVDGITAHYRRAGYFLTRTVLPPQDVSDGIFDVQVLEGLLDEADGIRIVPVAPGGRMNLALAQQIVATPLPAGQPLKLSDVERGLRLLNDVPGLSAAGNLEPGAPGTTRLVVDVSDGPLWRAQLSADNHGSRYTSSGRLGARVFLDNPTGRADQATAQLMASPNGDYRQAQVGYSLLALPTGLRLGSSASGLQYKLGQELSVLDAAGSATVVGVDARVPLQRSRQANLSLLATLEHKRLLTESLGTRTADKAVALLTAGVAADRSDDSGWTYADANLAVGQLKLRDEPTRVGDASPGGARTAGRFAKLNASVLRVQRLDARWSLTARAQAQLASKNLDSSEKFLLGGMGGIRAYPGTEAAGDSGLRTSLDLRWLARRLDGGGSVQFSGFVDAGWVRQLRKPDAVPLITPNGYRLAGAGLGAQINLPRNVEVSLALARPLGSNPGRNPATGTDADGRKRDVRAWLSVQVGF